MKKPMTFLLVLGMLISLAACGGTTSRQNSSAPPADSQTTEAASEVSREQSEQPQNTDENESSNILVAYFTWADNTVVADPSSVDVDAATSASVLAPGNAAKLASWIQQEVGGGLHSIMVEEPYLTEEIPSDGSPDQCDPDVGSLCYYIPWGNLCFFYQDFRASSSLIPLGQVETGAEFLAQLDLASRVAVEADDGET